MARPIDPSIRERIIQQAEHVFHLNGYNAACLEDIAKACGMTKANLFHHYGSKAQLALAVLDFKIAEFQTRKVAPLCAHEAPEAAVEEMFAEAGRVFGGIGCKAGCFVGNIALEMSDHDEAFRERVGRFFAAWSGSIAECLERCKASGYFGPGLDSRAAAEAVVALYEGAIMLARAQRDPEIFARAGRTARAVLEQHRPFQKTAHRRDDTMGPKTPCGC